MTTKKTEIQRIITDAVEELKRLQKAWKEEFRDVPPVLWFGDIESTKPKVLVISANPSRPDQPAGNPRIPSSIGWNINKVDISKLEDDYNRYFFNNPATQWFGKNNVQEGQGRIEDFLNGMDASFYGTKKYQAIHIDLIPFSTTTTFTQIDNQIMAIDGLPEWVDKHVKELIALIDPKVIIINGNSNFDFFNLCVNLGAQPYKAIVLPLNKGKEDATVTIWESSSTPKIIATSLNMGSYCMHSWQTIMHLGEQVYKHLKF
jgi:hypothetical protein